MDFVHGLADLSILWQVHILLSIDILQAPLSEVGEYINKLHFLPQQQTAAILVWGSTRLYDQSLFNQKRAIISTTNCLAA